MKNAITLVLLLLIAACGAVKTKSSSNKSSASGGSTASGFTRLTLDLTGAVGLAVAAPSASLALDNTSGTSDPLATLLKLNSDGSIASAFGAPIVPEYDGAHNAYVTPTVSQVWVKSDYTLILFAETISLIPPGVNDQTAFNASTGIYTCWDGTTNSFGYNSCPTPPQCLLGYAGSDGVIRCVDTSLTNLGQTSSTQLTQPFSGAALQFDNSDNVYYAGTVDSGSSADTQVILQKFNVSTGQVSQLVTTPFNGFTVSGNGDVSYFHNSLDIADGSDGQLAPAGVFLLPSGGSNPSTVMAASLGASSYSWIANFADGNPYVAWNGSIYATSKGSNPQPIPTTVNVGSTAGAVYNINQQTFSIGSTDTCSQCATIYQLYPQVSATTLTIVTNAVTAPTTVTSPAGTTIVAGAAVVSAQSGSTIVLAGTDKSGNNKLEAYDTSTQKETDLIPAGGIKVTAVSTDGTTVYFSGVQGSSASLGLLDSSTQLVTGTIDLGTLKLTTTPSTQTITQMVGL